MPQGWIAVRRRRQKRVSSPLVDEIIESMKRVADPFHARTTARYVKTSTLTFLGLRVAQVDEIVQEHTKELPSEDLLPIMNALWKTVMYEGRLGAVCAMKRYAKTGEIQYTLSVASGWIDDIDTWAVLDPLAIYCVGRLLLRDFRIETELTDWSRSADFWRRRASILSHILLCRKQFYKEEFSDMVVAVVQPHLRDREFYIEKAIGWLLRELSQRDPKRVETFIAENREVMARLTAREAGRKLKSSADKIGSNAEKWAT